MARAVRVEFSGAFYHVMARGDRGERIFYDEADRVLFYQTLGEACERTAKELDSLPGSNVVR